MMVRLRHGLSNARAFGIDSTFSVADQVASATVGFLAAVYVGREIGAEGLGIFAITSVLVLIVRSLQNSAILEAMSVFGPRRSPSESRKYSGFLLGSELLWVGGVTGLGAVAAILGTGAGILDQAIFPAILSCLAYANLMGLQHLLRRQFYVEHRPVLALTQSSMFLVMVMAGLMFLSLAGNPSIPSVYAVLAASSAAVCVLQYPRWWGRVALPDAESVRRYITEHWRYGRWVLLTIPFVIGMYRGYYFLVGYLLSAEQAGLLRAADTLVIPFGQIGIGLSMFLVPLAVRTIDDTSAARQRTWTIRLTMPLLVVAALYAAALLTLGKAALVVVFGEAFLDATPIIPVLALIPLFQALATPATIALTSLRRPDLKCLSYVVATIATLSIGLLSIKNFGVFGAAMGLAFSTAVFAATQWLCLAWLWRQTGTK